MAQFTKQKTNLDIILANLIALTDFTILLSRWVFLKTMEISTNYSLQKKHNFNAKTALKRQKNNI